MGARGFNLAEEGHIVSILSPQTISGGVTATVFNMKTAAKANIILQLGVQAAANTAVLLNACSSNSGAGATAIPFTYYEQTVAGNANDTLILNGSTPSTAFQATSAGFAPTPNANTFYILEVQEDQLPTGLGYIQLQITNGANVNYASAVAVLTGLTYAGSQQPTATT